jgi:hypothetical protein
MVIWKACSTLRSPPQKATPMTEQKKMSAAARKITLYRDDSTTQVVFENVKHYFWLAGNTVLCIAQYTDVDTGAHKYINWPRERFCWFKDEAQS